MDYNKLEYIRAETEGWPVKAYFKYSLTDKEIREDGNFPDNIPFSHDAEACVAVRSATDFHLCLTLDTGDGGKYMVEPAHQPESLWQVAQKMPPGEREKITQAAVEFSNGIVRMTGMDVLWMFEGDTPYGEVTKINPYSGVSSLKNSAGKMVVPVPLMKVGMIGEDSHAPGRVAYFELGPGNYADTFHAMRRAAYERPDITEEEIAVIFGCQWLASVTDAELSAWVHEKTALPPDNLSILPFFFRRGGCR